jgi:hypothetical protein
MPQVNVCAIRLFEINSEIVSYFSGKHAVLLSVFDIKISAKSIGGKIEYKGSFDLMYYKSIVWVFIGIEYCLKDKGVKLNDFNSKFWKFVSLKQKVLKLANSCPVSQSIKIEQETRIHGHCRLFQKVCVPALKWLED